MIRYHVISKLVNYNMEKKMVETKQDLRVVLLRLKPDMYKTLKRKAIEREMSINAIAKECLEKYINKCKKKLDDK